MFLRMWKADLWVVRIVRVDRGFDHGHEGQSRGWKETVQWENVGRLVGRSCNGALADIWRSIVPTLFTSALCKSQHSAIFLPSCSLLVWPIRGAGAHLRHLRKESGESIPFHSNPSNSSMPCLANAFILPNATLCRRIIGVQPVSTR